MKWIVMAGAILVLASGQAPAAEDRQTFCDGAASSLARWAARGRDEFALDEVKAKIVKEATISSPSATVERMAARMNYLLSVNFTVQQARSDLYSLCMNAN